jgi:IclR family KDG regulon transcriptional repressor
MESETEVRITFPIGRQLPLPSGAAGKCFLAYLPEGETEVILRRVKLPAYTPQSITDVEVYKKELLQVRRDGFATSMGEYIAGVNGVASPIFGPDGQVSLALTALGLSPALPPERLRQIGHRVKEFALEMTKLLDGPFDLFPS